MTSPIPQCYVHAERARADTREKLTAWDLYARACPPSRPHHAGKPKPCYGLAEDRDLTFVTKPLRVKRYEQ